MISSLLVPVVLALATAPPPRHDLDALLVMPVSPGVIGLLVPHVSDPRASELVITSITHADPAVRAAAARVASIAGLDAARAVVRTALETETDRSAASEQLRATIFMAPAAADLTLVPIARKHHLVDLVAEALASVRGPAALPSLDALREAGLSATAEATVIAAATRRGREGLNIAATSALRSGSVERWGTVLSLARLPEAAIAPGLLVAGIGAPKPAIRALTYWHLALTTAKDATLPAEIEAAIARTSDAARDQANSDPAFALIALRRAQRGKDFGPDWGGGPADAKLTLPRDAEGEVDQIGPLLTRAEEKVFSRRLSFGANDWMFERERYRTTTVSPGAETRGALWLAGGLPPRMLRDMMAVTGCKPAARQRAVALARYRPDGRARQVSVIDTRLPQACAEVAGPALGLTIGPPDLIDPARAERQTVLIVPLEQDALDCAEQPEPSAVERVIADDELGTIKEPRKVKNVAPEYPMSALSGRVQGTVVLDATISSAGCIRSLRVLRGVSPDIDAAAMVAISQWRYTPTLLNGTAVPVKMTVTINFRVS